MHFKFQYKKNLYYNPGGFTFVENVGHRQEPYLVTFIYVHLEDKCRTAFAGHWLCLQAHHSCTLKHNTADRTNIETAVGKHSLKQQG